MKSESYFMDKYWKIIKCKVYKLIYEIIKILFYRV